MTMKFHLYLQFLIFCCITTLNFVQSLDDINKNVIISLAKSQQLKGLNTTSASGAIVYKFYGIRYALPPTGDRRFKTPEPAPGWSGVNDAVNKSSVCPQIPAEEKPSVISEDCLFLNVFTPDVNSSLPVFVWIHGGGYYVGSAYSDGDGATFAPKGIVAVTINYRLGPFGFMSTGDDVMPGNYGLLDQVLALKWVQKNIRAFGGDPNQVTIGGESAGALSVSVLIVSPLAKGLFKRAIQESGSCLAAAAVERPGTQYKIKDATLRSASRVGCNQSTSSEVLQCLQKDDVTLLLNASHDIVKLPRIETIFGFLPDDPINLLKSGNYNKVDTLRGTNSGEFSNIVQDPENDGITRQQFITNVRALLSGLVNSDEIVRTFLETYLGNETNPFILRSNLVRAVTDITFSGGTVLEVSLVSSSNTRTKHFLYEFDYRVSDTTTPVWQRVAHGAERRFVFYPDSRHNYTSSNDKAVGEDVQTMWTNFIKFGDPTPSNITQTSENGNGIVKWNNFTHSSPNMLEIDVNSTLVSYPRLFLIPLTEKILNIMQSDVPITVVG